MKGALKLIGGLFVGLIIIVVVSMIVDISNDVEYKVLEEKVEGDGYYIRIETTATDEKDLKNLTDEIKSEYKGKDAVWLWIYKENSEELLAKARIPYNNKGQAMVGADSNDYIFEME